MNPRKCLVRVLSLISLYLLSGCVTQGGKPVLPQEGQSMRAIYESSGGDSDWQILDAFRLMRDHTDMHRSREMAEYTRTANNEFKALFKRLPNPTIVVYVYPHLAGKNEVGVPGYATEFTLYEKSHYALPGE